MVLGELNFIVILFFFLLSSIIVNTNTALHLLLTAELLWVTLYSLVLVMGLLLDNVNLLSLTFFFLILSAVEFGVGLIIILMQNLYNRSINLSDGCTNSLKFGSRFLNKVHMNLYKFV
jgi:NADH:ubiquinone oxidoreductase subunit K